MIRVADFTVIPTKASMLDIMGMGDMIAPENYLPFTTAMNAFTGCPWTTGKL